MNTYDGDYANGYFLKTYYNVVEKGGYYSPAKKFIKNLVVIFINNTSTGHQGPRFAAERCARLQIGAGVGFPTWFHAGFSPTYSHFNYVNSITLITLC